MRLFLPRRQNDENDCEIIGEFHQQSAQRFVLPGLVCLNLPMSVHVLNALTSNVQLILSSISRPKAAAGAAVYHVRLCHARGVFYTHADLHDILDVGGLR
jgi:hypothetical protein